MNKIEKKEHLENLLKINNWDVNIYAGNLVNRIKRHLDTFIRNKSELDLKWAKSDMENLKIIYDYFELDYKIIEKTIKEKFEY